MGRASIALASLLAACSGGSGEGSATASSKPPSPSASAETSGPTIVIGPSGVRGAAPLTGPEETCSAFHRCCDRAQIKATEGLGLLCSLAEATADGKCEEALKLVRSLIQEQKIEAPPGCL